MHTMPQLLKYASGHLRDVLQYLQIRRSLIQHWQCRGPELLLH